MRLRFVMLAVAAATLTVLPASAQSPEAVKHFKAGKDLRDADKCKEAIPEFQQSIQIEESIGGFYNLGFCQERLGNNHEALEAYTQARELAKKKNDERLREITSSRLALLDKAPHVTLTLPNTLPAGLEIHVDRIKIPSKYYSPGETVIFTSAGGAHAVLVVAPGYEDRSLIVTNDQAVPVELRRPPDKVTPQPGTQPEGGWMWQHWVGLAGVVAGTGLAVFGLASFIGYDVERSRLQGNFEEACQPAGDPDPVCTKQQADDQRLARNAYDENEDSAGRRAPVWIGVGGFGALMIIGGVALMIVAPIGGSSKTVGNTAKSSAKVQILPQMGPTSQGLSIFGTF